MIEYARLITKSSEGLPTIPPSASHDNGDWSSNDIYEHELYLDSITGYFYTRKGDEIVRITTTSLDFVPYRGATADLDLGAFDLYTNKVWLYDEPNADYGSIHLTDGVFHVEDIDGHSMITFEDGFFTFANGPTTRALLNVTGLTANRDYVLPNASGTLALTSDIPSLAGYVPTSRTITINGTTQDLSADRTFTVSTGITIGTTAITSGTVGRVLFEGTGNVVQESANLFWDNTNGRLGIGTSTPTFTFEVKGKTLVNSNTASTNSILKLTDGNNATFWLGMSTVSTVSTFFGSNGTLTIGKVIADNSEPSSTHAKITLNRLGNPSLALETWSPNVGISFSDSNNGTIRMNFPSASETALTTISSQNFSIGVASGVGSLTSTTMKFFQSTGNVGINTTTDAGYKLDVNGTARFGNISQTTNANSITAGYQGGFVLTGGVGSLKQDATTYNKTLLDCGYEGGLRIRPYSVGFTSYVDVRSDTSSALTVTSTNQGFLPPRLTTTQKNAIATPAEGLQVWDTTLKLMSVYNGTAWITL